jgi:hypothetical protein
MGVGDSLSAYPEIIDVRGYDPVQHNLFGVDVLHQDERWKDGEGNVWLLDEMKPSHRANLLRFLRRRAQSLAFNDSLIMLTGPMAPGGDGAMDAAEAYADEMWDDPAGWLEGTKLVTRLRDLVSEDDRRNAELAATEAGY